MQAPPSKQCARQVLCSTCHLLCLLCQAMRPRQLRCSRPIRHSALRAGASACRPQLPPILLRVTGHRCILRNAGAGTRRCCASTPPSPASLGPSGTWCCTDNQQWNIHTKSGSGFSRCDRGLPTAAGTSVQDTGMHMPPTDVLRCLLRWCIGRPFCTPAAWRQQLAV